MAPKRRAEPLDIPFEFLTRPCKECNPTRRNGHFLDAGICSTRLDEANVRTAALDVARLDSAKVIVGNTIMSNVKIANRSSHAAFLFLAIGIALASLGCGDDRPAADGDSGSGGGSGTETGAGDSGGGDTGDGDTDSGGTDGPEEPECQYDGLFSEAITLAMNNAVAVGATPDDFMEAARLSLATTRTLFDDDLKFIFGLEADGSKGANAVGPITWDPGRQSLVLQATLGKNAPMLITNANRLDTEPRGEPLAVWGRRGKVPYAVFASNPFFKRGNEAMDAVLGNTLRLMTGAADPGKVVLAHLRDESQTRAWLDEKYGAGVSYNDADACDGDNLQPCLTADTGALIISQEHDSEVDDVDAVVATVQDALDRGIPVMYQQRSGKLNPLGDKILSLLNVRRVQDNYWPYLRISEIDESASLSAVRIEANETDVTLGHLIARDFGFSVPDIVEDPKVSEPYQREFAAGASGARTLLREFDKRAEDMFATCDHAFFKLVALSADALRQDIEHPIGPAESDSNDFLRSYFANHAVLNVRPAGLAQPDRGSFDEIDHSGKIPVDKEVSVPARKKFRAAGVFALPGRAFTVTRLDQSSIPTHIFINSVRDGSTKEWGAYTRPKYLKSAAVPIGPGESVTLTSPYGGPVQIEFGDSGEETRFRFEGVGQHPYWAGPDDTAEFEAAVAAAEYSWVEISTESFELHTRLTFHEKSITVPAWNTVAKLTEGMQKYTHSAVRLLSGRQGVGVEDHPEVTGWANARGFTLPEISVVQHANLDRPSCGDGCSGNPYDAWWAFNPIGHGDLHEIGHGVQLSRFQIYHQGNQYGNHSVTNRFPFYGAWRYHKDTGEPMTGGAQDQRPLFDALQAGYMAGDRAGSFSTHMDDFLAGRISMNQDAYGFYLQAMAAARHADVISDGYLLIPRIHILHQVLKGATVDESTWASSRDNLGMGQLTLEDAKGLHNNDFMVLALSTAAGLDYTDFFDMFGVVITDAARAQVVAHGFPVVPRVFTAMEPVAHKMGRACRCQRGAATHPHRRLIRVVAVHP